MQEVEKNKKDNKQDSYKLKITISPKDTKLMEVMSRVFPKLRAEFARESMIEWDYLINTSIRTSRYLEKTFNPDYYAIQEAALIDRTKIVNGYTNIPVTEKEKTDGYVINLTVTPEDVILYDILSRVTIPREFAREAMYEWDFLLNTSTRRSNYMIKNTDPKAFNITNLALYNLKENNFKTNNLNMMNLGYTVWDEININMANNHNTNEDTNKEDLTLSNNNNTCETTESNKKLIIEDTNNNIPSSQIINNDNYKEYDFNEEEEEDEDEEYGIGSSNGLSY